MRWRLLLVSLLLWGAGTSALAQVEPAPGPTERVAVHLVQVPILALDRQGRPVKDLKIEELVVKHGGRRARIAYLEPLRPKPAAAVPAGVRMDVEVPGGMQSPSDGGIASQRVLLFLDVQNDDKLRHEEAELALVSFVQELPAGSQVGVSSFDGELHLDLPFTGDRTAVLSAIRSAWSRAGSPRLDLQAKVRTLISRFEDCVTAGNGFQRVADERCLLDVAREYMEEVRPATLDYLRALEGAVSYVGGLQGSKAILAVSHGVVVDAAPVVLEALRGVVGNTEQLQDVQSDLGFGHPSEALREQVASLAVRLRVPLHFVDRTLPPTAESGAASRSARFTADASPLAASHRAAQEDLKELAAATGGTFHASTRLLPGLRDAVVMGEAAYEVGYYVDDDLLSKRRDRVSIETTRSGVRVVHRTGRYGAPSTPAVAAGARIRVAESTRPAAAPGNVVRMFQIAADPRHMGYKVSETEASGNFTLHVLLKDEGGHVLVDAYRFFNHAYPREVWDGKDVGDVLINGWVEVPPGHYELAAVFRNTDTSWEGQVTRSLVLGASASGGRP